MSYLHLVAHPVGYTGEALALLSGRRRAYGFWHTERFLSQIARAGGDETLTNVLAQWTSTLWVEQQSEPDQAPPAFYLDGHKKPVYTDRLTPRGLVGRTGKVLGCRRCCSCIMPRDIRSSRSCIAATCI